MGVARWWGLALCFGWVAMGQTVPRRPARTPRPPNDQPLVLDCPAPNALPVAVDYSAASGDFVEVRRTDCTAGCPAYTVRVYGDGRVFWKGEKNVVVLGDVATAIDGIGAKALIQEVVSRGFWGLCGSYQRGGAAVAESVTTVSVSGRVRTVEDRGSVAPGWLRTVDLEVDDLTNSHRWRHGDPNRETFGVNRAGEDAEWPKVGVTRLMKVAARGSLGELKDMLADTSLDVNGTDSSGWTALMYAAQAGSLEAMGMLIERRADVSRRSNAGETAMSGAVTSAVDPRADEKVRMLWAAGVNINAADNRGVTPLMLAARDLNRWPLVKEMMRLGADPTKRDVDGRTAQDDVKAPDDSARSTFMVQSMRDLLVAPVKK